MQSLAQGDPELEIRLCPGIKGVRHHSLASSGLALHPDFRQALLTHEQNITTGSSLLSDLGRTV